MNEASTTMDTVFKPVAMGEKCEVKFQICRTLYFRKFPTRSEGAFRLTLMGATLGAHMFPWMLFDWQSAPFEAVVAYLERDFQGVFEREDLGVEHNEVVHKTLRTNHIHEFENIRRDGVVREEMIDEAYPKVRRKFERLVEKFREHLATPGDYLYISTDLRPEPEVRHLISLLQARNPDHRVHILFVPYDDRYFELPGLAGQVTVAKRPRAHGKPPAIKWEGNDAAWDAALTPFKLDLTFADSLSPTARPASKAGDEDADGNAPRGLLSRLFSR
jgi:hypothetical protein